MKRWPLVLLLALALAAPALAAGSAPKAGGKILLIIRDVKLAPPEALELMITKEAGVMKDMLQEAGYAVAIASPTGEPWGTPALALKPDVKLGDVNVEDYDAFIIPCLAIESEDLHPHLASAIKAAVARGKLMAAQNGGVYMLARAGVLSGKKYAAQAPIELPEMKGSIHSGRGVVKDGRILTSGTCPGMAWLNKDMEDGTAKLTEAVIADLRARGAASPGMTGASEVTGVYTLVSIDGKELPFVWPENGATVRAGTFTLNGDGTLTSKMVLGSPGGGESSREIVVEGTWTLEAGSLVMRWAGAGMTTGKVEGNVFTMENEGMTLRYRK